MSDESQAPDRSPPPKASSGGRWIAVFALLLALGGLGGFAYLYYTVVLLDPGTRVDGRLSALEGDVARLRTELQAMDSEQQSALASLRESLEQGQQAAAQALAESMQQMSAPQLPAARDWKLAEVGYLLRIANHRVLMERDVSTALDALNTADDILGSLDDVAMHAVRATLATEILSLEQAPSADIPGIYLRLDAVKRQIGALTSTDPKYSLRETTDSGADDTMTEADDAHRVADAPVAAEGDAADGDAAVGGAAAGSAGADAAPAATGPDSGTASPAAAARDAAMRETDPPQPEASGFLDALAAEIGSFVRFRRIDSGFNPPPTPEEAAYLELNLRLMLEQAQLAALRHEQAVYATSLGTALDLIGNYLDRQNPAVQETVQALEALRNLDVETPLPDISASLQALQNARETAR